MLRSANTCLREPRESDLEALATLRNDVELQLLLATRPRANTVGRVREWTARHLNDSQALFFVIANPENDAPIGYLQLTRMDFVSGTGELGICIAPSAQGKGHAEAAMKLLEDHARATFAIRKLVLSVLASNARAVAFYKKTGFAEVGVHKRHFYLRGAYVDVVIMERFLEEPR